MSNDKLNSAKLRAVKALAEGGDRAAQSELARRLVRRKQKEEALAWFQSAAESGDPEQQMELGIVLFWDHAAYNQGIKWIRLAAEQGHVGAQYFLGSALALGENIGKNLREAARWYRRAARQGHSEAQYNLALMYWAGEGVPRSSSAAHRWLEKAAQARDLLALRALSEAYEMGLLGYRRNPVRAVYWKKRYSQVHRTHRKYAGKRATTTPPVR
jgi:TPR repeat protein